MLDVEIIKALASDKRLLRSKKIKQWVFYQRDEENIAAAKEQLSSEW